MTGGQILIMTVTPKIVRAEEDCDIYYNGVLGTAAMVYFLGTDVYRCVDDISSVIELTNKSWFISISIIRHFVCLCLKR